MGPTAHLVDDASEQRWSQKQGPADLDAEGAVLPRPLADYTAEEREAMRRESPEAFLCLTRYDDVVAYAELRLRAKAAEVQQCVAAGHALAEQLEETTARLEAAKADVALRDSERGRAATREALAEKPSRDGDVGEWRARARVLEAELEAALGRAEQLETAVRVKDELVASNERSRRAAEELTRQSAAEAKAVARRAHGLEEDLMFAQVRADGVAEWLRTEVRPLLDDGLSDPQDDEGRPSARTAEAEDQRTQQRTLAALRELAETRRVEGAGAALQDALHDTARISPQRPLSQAEELRAARRTAARLRERLEAAERRSATPIPPAAAPSQSGDLRALALERTVQQLREENERLLAAAAAAEARSDTVDEERHAAVREACEGRVKDALDRHAVECAQLRDRLAAMEELRRREASALEAAAQERVAGVREEMQEAVEAAQGEARARTAESAELHGTARELRALRADHLVLQQAADAAQQIAQDAADKSVAAAREDTSAGSALAVALEELQALQTEYAAYRKGHTIPAQMHLDAVAAADALRAELAAARADAAERADAAADAADRRSVAESRLSDVRALAASAAGQAERAQRTVREVERQCHRRGQSELADCYAFFDELLVALHRSVADAAAAAAADSPQRRGPTSRRRSRRTSSHRAASRGETSSPSSSPDDAAHARHSRGLVESFPALPAVPVHDASSGTDLVLVRRENRDLTATVQGLRAELAAVSGLKAELEAASVAAENAVERADKADRLVTRVEQRASDLEAELASAVSETDTATTAHRRAVEEARRQRQALEGQLADASARAERAEGEARRAKSDLERHEADAAAATAAGDDHRARAAKAEARAVAAEEQLRAATDDVAQLRRQHREHKARTAATEAEREARSKADQEGAQRAVSDAQVMLLQAKEERKALEKQLADLRLERDLDAAAARRRELEDGREATVLGARLDVAEEHRRQLEGHLQEAGAARVDAAALAKAQAETDRLRAEVLDLHAANHTLGAQLQRHRELLDQGGVSPPSLRRDAPAEVAAEEVAALRQAAAAADERREAAEARAVELATQLQEMAQEAERQRSEAASHRADHSHAAPDDASTVLGSDVPSDTDAAARDRYVLEQQRRRRDAEDTARAAGVELRKMELATIALEGEMDAVAAENRRLEAALEKAQRQRPPQAEQARVQPLDAEAIGRAVSEATAGLQEVIRRLEAEQAETQSTATRQAAAHAEEVGRLHEARHAAEAALPDFRAEVERLHAALEAQAVTVGELTHTRTTLEQQLVEQRGLVRDADVAAEEARGRAVAAEARALEAEETALRAPPALPSKEAGSGALEALRAECQRWQQDAHTRSEQLQAARRDIDTVGEPMSRSCPLARTGHCYGRLSSLEKQIGGFSTSAI